MKLLARGLLRLPALSFSWLAPALASAAPLTYIPAPVDIRVPVVMQGVQPDPSAKTAGGMIEYRFDGALYPLDQTLPIDSKDSAELDPKNAWGQVRRYLKAEMDGKMAALRPLMSDEAWATFSKVDPASFAKRGAAIKKAPRFTPFLGIEHKGIVLMHWLDGERRIDVLPLKRSADGTYLIHPLDAGSDPRLGNIFQYAYFRPEPVKAPKLGQTFGTWKPSGKEDQAVSASLTLSKPGNFALFFRDGSDPKTRPFEVLGYAQDGKTEKDLFRFPDLAAKPGALKVEIKTSSLAAADPYELMVVELNFPPDGIPEGAKQAAARWTVTPPK